MLLAALLPLAFAGPSAAPAPAASVPVATPLPAWLEGCWRMELAGGGSVEERWAAPRGGAMFGFSTTVVGSELLEWEHLELRVVNGVLTYVALPSGQAGVPFRLIHSTDKTLRFENPANDFPNVIVYARTPTGVLAYIEGVRGGGPARVEFDYRPCQQGQSQ